MLARQAHVDFWWAFPMKWEWGTLGLSRKKKRRISIHTYSQFFSKGVV